MKKTNVFKRMLAISLVVLLMVTSNIIVVSAETGFGDNITISPDAQVNIYNSNGEEIQLPTQEATQETPSEEPTEIVTEEPTQVATQEPTENVTKPTQPQKQEVQSTGNQNVVELNILNGGIAFKYDGSSTQYKVGTGAWTSYTGSVKITSKNTVTGNVEVTQNIIVVESGTHNITLDGVNIDVSSTGDTQTDGECAFAIQGTSNVTLTLAKNSENTLKSGKNKAGLQVQNDGINTATLLIKSEEITDGENTGTLTTTGGYYGAGIGGSYEKSGGNITISSGVVTAMGTRGSGIGGGSHGATGGTITINGNAQIIAEGGLYGAGIGGGFNGDGENITISGNAQVTAQGGNSATGIGGGYSGTGGNVVISGNAKVKAYGGSSASGIGGGVHASGGNVTISDNAQVEAKGGSNGAGIGGGFNGAGGTISISGTTQVTAIAGVRGNVEYRYPCAIGSGSNNLSVSSRRDGAIMSIGNTAKVTAVAMGDGLTFHNKGDITAPTGETIANIMELNYENSQTGKTQLFADSEIKFEYDSTNEYKVIAFSSVESGKKYQVSTNNIPQQGVVGGEVVTAFSSVENLTTYNEVKEIELEVDPTLNINSSSIYLKNFENVTQYSVDNTTWYSYTGNLTIIGTGTATTNTVTVLSGTHNVTLDGVNIDVADDSNVCAFDIQGNSNVTLTLANNSTNTLKSGNRRAGLQVQAGATVEIKSEEVTGEDLDGKLTATGGSGGAGIGGGYDGAGGNITISGGTVNATGGKNGAGIGGGYDGAGGNITISGGTVNATGGENGAGIGGGIYGTGGNIEVSSGTVNARGGRDGAGIGGGEYGKGGNITISGSSTVEAFGGSRYDSDYSYPSAIGGGGYITTQPQGATLSIGNNATVTAVAMGNLAIHDNNNSIETPNGEQIANIIQLNYASPLTGKTELKVNDALEFEYTSSTTYGSVAFSKIDSKKTYKVFVNGIPQQGDHISGSTTTDKVFENAENLKTYTNVKASSTDPTFDVNISSIYLQQVGEDKQYSVDNNNWHTYTGDITIIGTTAQNTITVISGTHNITLDGVSIDVSRNPNVCAFDIQGTSNVTLILAKNSENILKSGSSKAGLQVQTDATVEIKSDTVTDGEEEGNLEAHGGFLGAGIGGGDDGAGGNITISSGTVTATGGDNGAGIGGGQYGNGGNITISGGANVTAKGGSNGSGIGGGYNGAGGNITISDNAKVTAKGGIDGAGIGGGDDGAGGNITISGNSIVTALGGNRFNSSYSYPSAIGVGSYNTDLGTKPAGATLSIGSDVTVTAVAKGDGLAIDDSDNIITAPDGETVANVIALNYQTPQTGTTQLKSNDVVEFEYTSDTIYGSVAFSKIDSTKTYKVYTNEILQQGKIGNSYKLDLANESGLKTYNDVKAIEKDITLDINQSSITLKQEGENKLYNYDNEWCNYVGDITIIGTTTTNTITVISGTHNIILDGVSIDVSGNPNVCAFDIQGTSNVNLTLAKNSENILKSGYTKAGLQVQTGATVEIKSEEVTGQDLVGSLTATGGNDGAGIGGGTSGTGGNITISGGIVIATGRQYGAGIGGGYKGAGEDITISGTANVTATGGQYGAGIGGGVHGAGGEITISGGSVVATGGEFGAGIGGGYNGAGGTITISGNSVVTAFGGKSDNSNYSYPSAIGSGSFYISSGGSSKPDGAILSIGSNAKVTAVAMGDGLAIHNKGVISAPDGETVANIIQLNYATPQTGTTQLKANDVVEFEYTSETAYGSVAFTKIDSTKTYSVVANGVVQQGDITVDAEKVAKTEFTSSGNLTIYDNVKRNEIGITLKVDENNIYLREDSGLTQYSTDNSTWYNYVDDITITSTDTTTPTQNTITVINGTHNITLNGVNIDVGNINYTCAFDIQGTSDVTLTLAKNSENILKSGNYEAGLQVQAGATVEIKSKTVTGSDVVGSLEAHGGRYGAGIGGGDEGAGGKITISGGTVTATGGDRGSGIGGGYKGAGGTITISGSSVVTAIGGNSEISNLSYPSAIGGGSYYIPDGVGSKPAGATLSIGNNATVTAVAKGNGLAIDDNDNIITAPDGETVANVIALNYETTQTGTTQLKVNNVVEFEYTSDTAYSSVAFSSVDSTKSYRVLFNGISQQGTTLGGTPVTFFANTQGGLVTYNNVKNTGISPIININSNNIYLREDGGATQYSVYNTTWYTYTGDVTIIGSGNVTQNTITVINGTHNITLDGVNIDVSAIDNACAFDIQGTSNVTLTLAENSENTLKSWLNYAGIQVLAGARLIITDSGTGTLTAEGGAFGAGIGGGDGGTSGAISINGGTVTAIGGGYGAGIGGGYSGDGGNITISGTANVTATGGNDGAGIGGGNEGSGGTITISGNATVKAFGGNNAISDYSYPSAIGGGSYNTDLGTKPAGATLSIGNNATVTAVAMGNSLAIDDSDNIITAPDGETVANVIELNYETTQTGTTQLKANNVVEFECTSENEYGAVAFSKIDSTKTYTVLTNGATQQGDIVDGETIIETVAEFTSLENLTTYDNVKRQEIGVTLNVNENNIYLREDSGLTQYSTDNSTWYKYVDDITITGTTEQYKVVAQNGTHNVILDNVNINVYNACAFEIQSSTTVKLILAKDSINTLQSGSNSAGLQVHYSATLTIASEETTGEEKEGKLTATGGYNGAGIGGKSYLPAGTITINSGEIEANGGNSGAGIGGGNGGSGGTITINGGNVTAKSYAFAAGIGGGKGSSSGNILIKGGIVTATGGQEGAGIGSGNQASFSGTITIESGTVKATGGTNGAGIGGGSFASGGTINISSNAIVKATGGDNGAGIGVGNQGLSATINISGGTVEAKGGYYAAGIGGGNYAKSSDITISGGTVTTTGGVNGAGIGGGNNETAENITISSNAKVTAIGGNNESGYSYPSAIGAGSYDIEYDEKPAGAILSIGNDAQIIAVAKGDGLAIDDSDNTITAPDGETVGNVIELYYETAQTGKTELYTDDQVKFWYDTTEEYKSIAFSGIDSTKLYLVFLNDILQQGAISGEEVTTNFESLSGLTTYNNVADNIEGVQSNPTLNISENSIYISRNRGLNQYSKDGTNWVDYEGKVTIIGTTTQNTVTVISGTHNITLDGVNIDVSETENACAFDIQGNSNVTLTLANDSTNTLKSGPYRAGLQVQNDGINIATVSINDEKTIDTEKVGSLTVKGGFETAGIGSASYNDCGVIAISGGIVKATGGDNGAGIGGSVNGAGGDITISGGIVEAFGSFGGAGIGGGDSGAGGDITISGGIVEAFGSFGGAGIGGGDSGAGGDITISGGTVEAFGSFGGAGIGGGKSRAGGNITINNATVEAFGGEYASGIGGGQNGAGGVITISGTSQVKAIGGNVINDRYYSPSAIGGGSYTDIKPESATLSIGNNAKVIAISTGEIVFDSKGDILAPTGESGEETVASIIGMSFDIAIPSETLINLKQGADSFYSFTTTIDGTRKIAYTGLEENTDYQLEMQYPNQTAPLIKHGIIEGEVEEKDSFNTLDRQITSVEIVDEIITSHFMITQKMLNSGWASYLVDLKAVTDTNEYLSMGNGLEVKNLSKEELTAFNISYTLDGVLIGLSVFENAQKVKIYMNGQEFSEKLTTPAMITNDIKDKVIYIGDYENYNSTMVDSDTLIKNLTYTVNIEFPQIDEFSSSKRTNDLVYIGTDARKFAIIDSRYNTYIFSATDDKSPYVDRRLTLKVTDVIEKTYNLSLPLELLESDYPNLYSNATEQALADTLIYAISIDGSTTTYSVYDNTYSGFENQYTANMFYGKTVWLKAPQTVASGEFVGWYNIDKQMFVSYENEYKFIMTQNTKLVPIYNDNTEVTVSETPYALSENALYETYLDSFGVTKIRFTTPLTYFPQNVDGASLKVRYQVALNDESVDLNGEWTEKDLTQSVNAQNRVNFYLTANYYNTDGTNNEMTIYVQPYVQYNNGVETVDTKSDVNAITTLKYEYPVY